MSSPSDPTSPARPDRRRDILDAALACFLEQGIEPTTIEAIRERCGASVGSIYHHFGSKDGILAALCLRALDEQSASMARATAGAPTPRDGVRGLVLGYLDWVQTDPIRARFLFQARPLVARGPRAADLAERARQRNAALLAWFEPHRASGALRDLPCEIYPSLVIGPAQSYSRAWLAGGEMAPPAVYREVLADAAWRAVAAPDACG